MAIRLSLPRDTLVQLAGLAGRAVSTRASVQILAGIHLRAEDGLVELSATDIELSLRASGAASVESEGAVVVPGRLLLDISRLLPPGEVLLEHRPADAMLHLTCGSSSFKLHTYDAADFPRLPQVPPPAAFDVPREAFLETLGRVSRAASRDESRPVLTGVLVQIEGDRLVMAATDSYRLAVKETTLDRPPGQDVEAIVPARALAEVARIAQGTAEDALTLAVQENQVLLCAGGVWLTARRIEGQFPNYRQLRPETFEAFATVGREELGEAVRRVGLMAQRNTAVRMRFEEGQLAIRAQTQDVGEAEETIPVSYSGEPMEIGFNPQFLLDGLDSLTGQEARINLINPLRPGLLTGDGDDFWYLIMPIRLAS
jgi:DNA polymerase-3 subunit beta